jgi:hypothetical protein
VNTSPFVKRALPKHSLGDCTTETYDGLTYNFSTLRSHKIHTHSVETVLQILKFELGTVTHSYNPIYSGGRDQEDRGSKPAGATSFRDPISKKHITHKKMAGGVAQVGGPEFKPQCQKKMNKFKA